MARRKEDEDVVTLITVHSAKGTEAPVCYVLRVQEGNYPHVRSLGEEKEVEEERRVLHVAMTRAQDELILTRTLERRGVPVPHGGRSVADGDYSPPACFLDTIPPELMDLGSWGMVPQDDHDVITPYR